MMKKKKIALDIDDVLIDFNTGFLKFFNEKLNTSHTIKDITAYEYHTIFDVTKEKSQEIIDEFMDSFLHLETPPVVGVVEGLKLINHHEIILISARPEKRRKLTIDWIEKHLQGLAQIHSIILTGQYHGETKKKGEIAKEIGIDMFVEDSLANAYDIANHGIPVLLFDTPWNQDSNLPLLITRVKTWEEIVAHINKIEG